jgi:hypothetical protein
MRSPEFTYFELAAIAKALAIAVDPTQGPMPAHLQPHAVTAAQKLIAMAEALESGASA